MDSQPVVDAKAVNVVGLMYTARVLVADLELATLKAIAVIVPASPTSAAV
jgi:hypothetical protein